MANKFAWEFALKLSYNWLPNQRAQLRRSERADDRHRNISPKFRNAFAMYFEDRTCHCDRCRDTPGRNRKAKTMNTENVIRLYHKTSKITTRKPAKAKADSVRAMVALKCRVQRPELLDHLLSGAFHAQEALAPSVVDNRVERIISHHGAGWTIPAGSLGRNGRHDANTAQSILLWIKQNVPTIDPSEVSVVVEPAKAPKV